MRKMGMNIVELQPVEHVAGVAHLPSAPLGAQYAVEHTLLHAVLRLYSENVAHPHRRYVQCEVAQYECRHDAHGEVYGAFRRARRHVDGMLHRPHLREARDDLRYACGGVEHRLQPVASPLSPQPFHYPRCGVLRVRYLEYLSDFHLVRLFSPSGVPLPCPPWRVAVMCQSFRLSAPHIIFSRSDAK